MRDWLSASEIAVLALAGLPRTRRGVLGLAKRCGWHEGDRARLRKGRGGGLEFHYTLFPACALFEYLARHSEELTLSHGLSR
jgi:hypothetical protein